MCRTTRLVSTVTPVLIWMLIALQPLLSGCKYAPSPKFARSSGTFPVTGLLPETTYFLAVKAADEVPNLAQVSSSANGATGESPSPGNRILIPPGTFIMGDGEVYCGKDEHQVTLTRAFYLGQYEVTNQEYRDALQWAYDHGYVTVTPISVLDNLDGSARELVDLNGDGCQIAFSGGTFTVESGKGNHPMVRVSWYGAAAYCDWLSMQQGLPRAYDHSSWRCNGGNPYGAAGYRLPTDAEWEFVAQHDDERVYPWGNEPPSPSRAGFYDSGSGSSSVVGSYPAAPESLGLYDMAGNVWEWCNDWHTCSLDSASVLDPTGPPTGMYRVLRGGAWCSHWPSLRCAARHRICPWMTSNASGFRYARSQ
jgi:formylglycine-generating enzyme required for sulfatase activity